MGARQGFGLRHRSRPCRDYVNGEPSSVVREPHCPIEPVFDLHVRGPDGVVNLIERPLIGNREILPQTSTGLDTQGRIQRAVRRRRSMQIHRLGREHGELLIVARQIRRQELIRGFRRNTRGMRLREFTLRRQEKFRYICDTLDLWEWEIRVLERLERLSFDLDLTRRRSATVAKLCRSVSEFDTYIRNNRAFIPNFGERSRQGDTITTAFVESKINQVVSKRFVKKQQMQWTPEGAHFLLQTRTRVRNGDLDAAFRCWYPRFQQAAA